MFIGLLRLLMLPVLLAGLIWLGAVIYFQQTGQDLDGAGILLWFIVLPLGGVIAWFAGRAVVGWAKQPSHSAPDGAAVAASAAPALPPSPPLTLAVLAAEFVTAGGDDPLQLQADHGEGRLRPALMSELLDQDGLPIRGLHCGTLTDETVSEWVGRWCAAARRSEAEGGGQPQGARLLALLADPLDRALAQLAALPPLPVEGDASSEAAPARPVVTKIFAPEAWQDMLATYVRERVAHYGKFSVGIVRPGEAAAEGPDLQFDALRIADAFCAASFTQYAQSVLLIVGCDSLVSAAQVEVLEHRQCLFSAHRQQGRMPGEAAAVFMAVPEALGGTVPAPLARLHRTAYARRQKPVDAAGRTDAADLQAVVSRALLQAKHEGPEVRGVVSDCDHRGAWQSEVAQAVGEVCPTLDPIADHLSLGDALGWVGRASSTLSLCVAAALTAQAEQRTLTLSVDDTQERSGLVLDPWPSTQS